MRLRTSTISLLAIFSFAACSSLAPVQQEVRAPSQAAVQSWETLIPKSQKEAAPNPAAIKNWREVESYVSGLTDPARFVLKPFKCTDQNLYPTHPQQTHKKYSVFEVATYDHFKLQGDDEACTTSARARNSKGILHCLRPDLGYYVVVSDTYMDRCGNFYRGFKDLFYLKKNETMGTLLSPGRTVYPKVDSQFNGEFIDGGTYPVPLKEFRFLTSLDRDELLNIDKFRSQALSVTHTWNSQLFIWEQKK